MTQSLAGPHPPGYHPVPTSLHVRHGHHAPALPVSLSRSRTILRTRRAGPGDTCLHLQRRVLFVMCSSAIVPGGVQRCRETPDRYGNRWEDGDRPRSRRVGQGRCGQAGVCRSSYLGAHVRTVRLKVAMQPGTVQWKANGDRIAGPMMNVQLVSRNTMNANRFDTEDSGFGIVYADQRGMQDCSNPDSDLSASAIQHVRETRSDRSGPEATLPAEHEVQQGRVH